MNKKEKNDNLLSKKKKYILDKEQSLRCWFTFQFNFLFQKKKISIYFDNKEKKKVIQMNVLLHF